MRQCNSGRLPRHHVLALCYCDLSIPTYTTEMRQLLPSVTAQGCQSRLSKRPVIYRFPTSPTLRQQRTPRVSRFIQRDPITNPSRSITSFSDRFSRNTAFASNAIATSVFQTIADWCRTELSRHRGCRHDKTALKSPHPYHSFLP